jgi:hypothetical protein
MSGSCCCALVIVILGAKRIIAIANTATKFIPIVVAGETNDREDTLMMPRTNKYRFYSKIRIPF